MFKLPSFFIVFFVLSFSSLLAQEKTYHWEFYELNKPKEHGWLLKNEKTDYWITYHENGKIKSEGYYSKNVKVLYWKYYNENGKLVEEGSYLNGIKDGYWKYYNDNGTPNTEGIYVKNKKTDWWTCYKDDYVIKTQYRDDIQHGYKAFYINDKCVKVEEYNLGQLIKKWDEVDLNTINNKTY